MPSLTDRTEMVGSAVRYICLVAIVLALPLTAGAQQRRSADRRSDQSHSQQRGSGERRSGDRQPDAQRPATTSPLPWWERQQTPAWERQRTPASELNRIPGWETGNVARALLDRQRTQRQLDQQLRHGQIATAPRRWPRYQPSVIYVLPSYGNFPYVMPATEPSAAAPPPALEQNEPLPRLGGLRLEVEPRESLQVFLDGVYIGTPLDLADELELTPGVHRLELRAPGHRTLAFDIEIVSARLTTYRGALERIEPASSPVPPTVAPKPNPPAPTGSKTMYVIPGCYLGNVSPKNVALPQGCDIGKMTTIVPPQ